MISVAVRRKAGQPNSRKNRLLSGAQISGIVILMAMLLMPAAKPEWAAKPELAGLPTGNRAVGFPFLLESGWSRGTVARVQIVIWFDNAEIPATIRAELLRTGWAWQERRSAGAAGRQVVTLACSLAVDKDEEAGVKKWYAEMDRQVHAAGGRIYLDERVAESIDIAGYLSAGGVQPKQWSAQDGTWSLTGYVPGWTDGIQAGADWVNVQVVRRSGDGAHGGLTALALPVLLNEF